MSYKVFVCPLALCNMAQFTRAKKAARCVSCGKTFQLETKKHGRRWIREFDNPQAASAWVRAYKEHEAETRGVRCPVLYINQKKERGL